jgi:hypothetical protein
MIEEDIKQIQEDVTYIKRVIALLDIQIGVLIHELLPDQKIDRQDKEKRIRDTLLELQVGNIELSDAVKELSSYG